MSKVNKVKEWLKIQMKNKKFVTTTIVFLVLLVAVVFGLTISFSGILGSAYDVDSIEKNIDKIKIGDTINYSANGYSDWEVLNINKEDNTIDIVSKTSVEDLTIKVEDIDNYYDILQNTANKYLDGKYAVSARSVSETESKRLDITLGYWVNKRYENQLYHSWGSVISNDDGQFSGYIMPLVTLNVGDSTVLNVGDTYNYSLNGINEWVILYIDDPTNISIVPKTPIYFESTYKDLPNFSSYVKQEVEKFKMDNVISVRSISDSDLNAICNISNVFDVLYDVYTDTTYNESVSSTGTFGIVTNESQYDVVAISIGSGVCDSWGLVTRVSISWTGGFVPVVTLKYDSSEKTVKDVNGELEVGDYVKYSVNGYDNWKVLNIDNKKNTVDIISGGIVKNLTLEGKEDYDNLDKILQTEADKYKSGYDVISARAVSIDDFDALRLMKDVQSAEFFLNNKKKYRLEKTFSSITYACAVGSYDMSISGTKYEWAVLGERSLYGSSQFSGDSDKTYEYTAGLRPIITLKLSDVKESDDKNVTTGNDNSLVKEQNKANQSTQETITNEEVEKAEKVEENEFDSENELTGAVSELTATVNTFDVSLKEQEKKNKQFLIFSVVNLISTIGVGIFSAVGILGKFR